MDLDIVLIDDELSSINRLKRLIEHLENINIVGIATLPEEGIKLIEKLQPHLAIVDIEMPKVDGFELIKHLRGSKVDTKIVVASGHNQYILDAFRSGVFDFLLKPVSIVEIKKCILRYRQEILFELSEKELSIIRLLCKGLNSKEIGEELFLAKSTIDSYRKNILEKTACKNTAALVGLFAPTF